MKGKNIIEWFNFLGRHKIRTALWILSIIFLGLIWGKMVYDETDLISFLFGTVIICGFISTFYNYIFTDRIVIERDIETGKEK